MRRIIAVLLVMVLGITMMPSVFAAEEVATNYFTETFTSDTEQPLATSTTKGFNGWVLEKDESSTEGISLYEKSLSEGTKMTVTQDPKDSTNKVLKLERSVSGSSYTNTENLRGIHTLDNGVRLNSGVIRVSMKYMYTQPYYCLMIDNIVNQFRQDKWQPSSTGIDYPSEHTALMAAKANEWHDLEFIMDYDSKKLSLYVDDTLIDSVSDYSVPTLTGISLLQPRHQYQSATTVYIDDIKVDKIDTIASYKADKVFYSTADGVFTSTAIAGGLLKQAYITKADSASGNGTAVFACYDADNQMHAVKVVSFASSDFVDNTALLTVDMPIPSDADLVGGKTRVFFIDSLEKLVPLEEPSSFDIVADTPPEFFLLGDSGMSNYKTVHFPRAGTGMMIGNYFDGITVNNQATSGAGTDTILGYAANPNENYGQSKWEDIIKPGVSVGDYILIQLGGNDAMDDIGVDNFMNYMEIIVDTLHKKGVNIIMGSIRLHHEFDENGKFRANFDENGKFISSDMFTNENGDDYLQALYDYIEEKESANMPGFMSIDTAAFVAEWIGEDATIDGPSCGMFMMDTHRNYNRSVYETDPRAATADSTIFGIEDDVHLTIYGADIIAQATARMIYELNVPLSNYVNVDKLDDEITYPHLDYQYAE